MKLKDLKEIIKGRVREAYRSGEVTTLPKPGIKPKYAEPDREEKRPSPLTPPQHAPKTAPKGMFESEIMKQIEDRYKNLKEGDSSMKLVSILQEVSIEQLKQQWVESGKIKEKTFEDILQVTNKSAYVTWLVSMVGEKKIKEEDIYKFKEYLSLFERHKNKYPIKDIGQIKDSKDLDDFIRISFGLSNTEKEDPSLKKGITKGDKYKDFIIGTVDGYIIYEIPKGRKDLYGASCELGSGTSWCTATGNTRSHFDSYIQKGPLFIAVNPSTKDKMQFHYETSSFKDKADLNLF
jgi:hypothetical protein